MDGTLLDLHFDNHFWPKHVPRRYSEKHGISFEQGATVFRDPRAASLYDDDHSDTGDRWVTSPPQLSTITRKRVIPIFCA